VLSWYRVLKYAYLRTFEKDAAERIKEAIGETEFEEALAEIKDTLCCIEQGKLRKHQSCGKSISLY